MMIVISLIHIHSCLLCYNVVENSYTINCHIRLAEEAFQVSDLAHYPLKSFNLNRFNLNTVFCRLCLLVQPGSVVTSKEDDTRS